MSYILKILDRLTMYQLMIYCLLFLTATSFVFSALDILSKDILGLTISLLTIMFVGLVTHYACVKLFKSPNNIQSSVISLLILFLIVSPSSHIDNLLFVCVISFLVIFLKYILVWRGRHVFNPVAVAIFVAGVFGYMGSEWWIGNRYMLLLVAVTTLLIALKLRKVKLVLFFTLLSVLIASIYFYITDNVNFLDTVKIMLMSYPTVFLAGFMLTEPNGLPGSEKQQYVYASVVSGLFSLPFSFGGLYGTPELAIIVGNLYSTFAESKAKYKLRFLGSKEVAKNIREYYFESDKSVNFEEGQYLEWTLEHNNPDQRGIKRTFTISSCNNITGDTKNISFAVKHLNSQSSYKNALEKLEVDSVMYASLLSGDFVLNEKDKRVKVFLAGGIGITPFISFIRKKILLNERMNYVLFYCVNKKEDLAFLDELERAKSLGFRLIKVFSQEVVDGSKEDECSGYLNYQVVKSNLEDLKNTKFYISGPSVFVESVKKDLVQNKVTTRNIVTDYFSGL